MSGTVALPDGRRIGYAEYGVPHGIPLLYFHGIPSGRFYRLGQDPLEAAGVRLLTLERPAIGLSDPDPGRTLLDWPTDVAAVADHFGYDRFGVLGYSAGAPNALACGYALAERVAVVGCSAGLGPHFDNPQFDRLLPPDQAALLPVARADVEGARVLVREFMAPTAQEWAADPDAFFETFITTWAEVDQPFFRAERERWMNILEATYQHGSDAITEEVIATYGAWGFDPADIRVPVHWWHGTADLIPMEVARFVVDRIPGATLTEYEGEGHVLDEKHQFDWLATLTAWAR